MGDDRSAARATAPRKRVQTSVTDVIAEDGVALSSELRAMRDALSPPASAKTLRSFSSSEAPRLMGIADAYLRQLSLAGKGPQPTIVAGGLRFYTLALSTSAESGPRFFTEKGPSVVGLLASTRGGAAGQGCGAGARAGSSGRDLVRRGV